MLKKKVFWLTLLTTSAAVTEIFVFTNTDICKSNNTVHDVSKCEAIIKHQIKQRKFNFHPLVYAHKK